MLRPLVLPHIASFNSMVEDVLARMVGNLPTLEFKGYPEKRTLFFIDDLLFCYSGDKPDSLTNSTNSGLYPSECKLRGQSYVGWMKLSWCLSEDGIVVCQSHKFIDQIPIMVMSRLCMLHKLSAVELMQHGEEQNEAGGYFIVNGQEKLIRLLVVQRRNFPIALVRDVWRHKGDIFSNKGISIRCVNADFSVCIMIVHYLNNGSCSLSISRAGQVLYFPFIYVLKALIDSSDFDIFQELMAFNPENDFLEACIISMLRTSLEKGLSTQCDFLDYLGKIYRIKMDVPEWYNDIDVGRLFLSECICIHLDDPYHKFLLLVEICNKLYALAQGKISPDNLDSPMLQEVLLPGCIYLSVLRSAVINWMKNLRSDFEKQMIRKTTFDREEYLNSIANFSDISCNISNRISNFIATGNTSRDVLGIPQFKGLTILAERVNFHRYLSHFCSIHRGNFFAEIRTTFVRKLLPEAFGFLCPVNTPDGSPCGLLNHISKSCYVTTDFECVDYLKGLLVQKGMKPIQELSRRSYFSQNEDKLIRILLDGCIIGYCSDSDSKLIVLSIRNLKISSNSSISHYLEIVCSPSLFGSIFPGLYIFSTPGRFMRPLLNIHENGVEFVGSFEQDPKKGKPLANEILDISLKFYEDDEFSREIPGQNDVVSVGRKQYKQKRLMLLSLKELYQQLLIKFQDHSEVYLHVCGTNDPSLNASHKELDDTNMLSILATFTPFSDHNQSPRNMYQCQMSKQTMGTPCHAFETCSDNRIYRLFTPQSPVIRSSSYFQNNMDEYPQGLNAVVAVISHTGYDMEDAMIINKYSLERGFGHGCVYKNYKIDLTAAQRRTSERCNLQFGTVGGVSSEVLRFLDPDGLPILGTFLMKGIPFYAYYDTFTCKQVVQYYQHEQCWVEKVSLLGPTKRVFSIKTGFQNVCIKVRISRNATIGDKFANRHGQKGICSKLWPTENMPFSESGITPDILFNPHGFPSRMTIGMTIEVLAGKAACVNGCKFDSTAFLFSGPTPAFLLFSEELVRAGCNYFGTERMYSGFSGSEFETDIFLGPIYYQRLRHMVSDKFQVRTTGSVNPVTHQPVQGRKRAGGMRFGEMERDCLLSHGTSFLLKDRLLNCSDKAYFYVCFQCGSLISSIYNQPQDIFEDSPGYNYLPLHIDIGINSSNHRHDWLCSLCGDFRYSKLVVLPFVFRLLIFEMASMRIKLSLRVN